MPKPLPGAPAATDLLLTRLRDALAAKGPAYQPRTHHLEGAAPTFTNRLILESSPYLLQHAHNPVNWFPWGDEAFEEARRLRRPVLLSVGYSTCHWCHVMEGESFEDDVIARAMNEQYVCIKVDREERPDVDAVYMTAVQALHGSGGWPMTVWLTPDRRPFFAGTYFPPRDGDRGAHRGFLSLLGNLKQLFDQDPARIEEHATELVNVIREEMSGKGGSVALPETPRLMDAVAQFYGRNYDPVYGGLKRAPKFPSNLPARLLLRQHRRTGDARVLQMVTHTLEKMAAGGMYDQLAGGFHRYSVDEEWLVPHFEKMLYDNALLLASYTEAFQVTKRADFARVARETADYLLREMRAPEGGFYSATDADSEGEEGKFFVWSEAELRAVLGAEADRFIAHYGVSRGGNFEGHNILCVARPDEGEWAALAGARQKLLDVRSKRVPPLRDEKVLAAWNGLAVAGLALAGRVLGEPRYVDAARAAADFVLTRMQPNGRLARAFMDGRAAPDGFLQDHAFVVQGLLALYEATFEPRWLSEAVRLAGEVEAHFADARGGWFLTRDDAEVLLAREKPSYDGAEPAGSSVHLLNVLRLAAFTGEDRFRKVAQQALASYASMLAERPIGLTEMLCALDFARGPVREVVLAWPPSESPAVLRKALGDTFAPHMVLLGASDGAAAAALLQVSPLIDGRASAAGKPTAFVCELGACQLPTTSPETLVKQLTGASL